MRYISAQLPHPIRFVGLSTSLANAADLAEWLGVPSTGMNPMTLIDISMVKTHCARSYVAGLFNFHYNVRLSPLEVSLQAFDLYHRPSRLLAMSRPTYQCIKKNCKTTKPAIVFCPDRKQTRVTAVDLSLHAAADDQPKMFLHVSGTVT